MIFNNRFSELKALLYHVDDSNGERVLLCALNKFLKDTILNMFLDDMKSFGSNVNLAEFYFTKEEHNTLTLHIPKDLRDKIKDALNKEDIVIKVDLN